MNEPYFRVEATEDPAMFLVSARWVVDYETAGKIMLAMAKHERQEEARKKTGQG